MNLIYHDPFYYSTYLFPNKVILVEWFDDFCLWMTNDLEMSSLLFHNGMNSLKADLMHVVWVSWYG